MEKEIWKDIPGYPNYMVSSFGRVRSIESGKIRAFHISDHGYYRVGLYNESERKTWKVHQLVAMAFLGYAPNGSKDLIVDHIDGDRLNNRLDNLQLITQRENCTKNQINRSSRYVGVCYRKSSDSWQASINHNGKLIHLGTSKDELVCAQAYQTALFAIESGLEIPKIPQPKVPPRYHFSVSKQRFLIFQGRKQLKSFKIEQDAINYIASLNQ